MICLFHRLCKSQQFPRDGLFSGEKETLVESNEPSLIKVRWLAHLYDRITHCATAAESNESCEKQLIQANSNSKWVASESF